MRIYILTRGRGPSIQYTHGIIKDAWSPISTLCHPEDVVKWPTWDVQPVPHTCLAELRQWVLENNEGKVLMIDDDFCNWSVHRGEKLWTKATLPEIAHHLAAVEALLDEYPLVGIGQRFMAHTRDIMSECSRVNGAIAMDCTAIKRIGAKFRLRAVEDFDFNLQVLTSGHKSLTYSRLVYEQKGSNTAGGCSIYRTDDVQVEAVMQLQSYFPDVVRVVKKITKGSWGGKERTDVVCQWKKAFLSSKPSPTGYKSAS